MKLIISISLAVACALAVALGGNSSAPQAAAYKTQLIHVEAVDVKPTKPKPHRVTRPRVARVPVRATRSVRRQVIHYSTFNGTMHYGRASWYTGNFGACGRALTGYYAASRTLPCGSHVLVSYGGRSVVVTILDRGPQSTLRDLDLSRSAFAALASTSKGVIWVHWKLQ
jgi:rare lipoprotein A (peptidoglycan hydrolase)